MKNKRSLLIFLVLLISALGCRFDRVLNPALPTFTPTVNIPPTPTTPPTPTPIPTPEPGARIKSGDLAFFYGDWDSALREYSQALENTTENEVKSAALLGLGRTYLKNNQLKAALETLNTGILTYADSPHRALMFFALAQTHEALNQPLEAISAYQSYLDLRPGLVDHYIYENIGENYLKTES